MRALLLAIVLASCGSHDAATSQPAPTAPAPKPAPTVDPCAALDQAYDDALAHASGACKTADDCACYPGGLGAHPTCGGVTDRASVASISAIANQHYQLRCRTTLQCGPSRCEPRCDQGRCK